ncbi:hypothetical protein [uncultured Nitratireductor sp.]|uniref:hypothetical protein n=1 Tax=uncultured Nitratireductor sp. TaxID=520953 RepID=UPI0025F0D9FE|nr:hypothetical protein [uncultured Nitratireductor sp.]
MTIILEEAARPSHATFAGGVASLADIAGAGRDTLLYIDNANAQHEALDRALEDRIRAIHSATGQKIDNPLRRADSEWRRAQIERPAIPNPFNAFGRTERDMDSLEDLRDRYMADFEQELFTLDERFAEIPKARQAIGAGRPIADDAARVARQADERLGQLMASRPGVSSWGAMLAGGMAGSLYDPVTLLSLGLGAGPSAARTAAGRILSIAGKEALINAGTEAVIQPSVQAWRKKAGLDSGLDQAISNVLFAGVFGGVLGGGMSAAGEGVRRLVRPRDIQRAAGTLRERDGRLSEPARAILADDGLRAADSLAEIREALPAEARGALDAAESVRLADEQRPASASATAHDRAIAAADEAINLPDLDAWPGFSPDPEQVERVARAIAGPAATAGRDRTAEASLVDFLIDRGGVEEFRGELAAVGAGEVARPFRGRLVKEGGQSLDYAREAAAEAGYFDHLYGSPAEAVQRSTVADLLNELDTEIRGGQGANRQNAEDAAFAGLESTVATIARQAGPAVDDGILERAARLVVDEGEEPFDALERVLVNEELSNPQAAGRTGEPLPGWSDNDLLAASDARGTVPEPDALDAPGQFDPADADLRDFAEIPDDMLIPTDDGLVPAAELLGGIERQDNLLRVAQACRV